MKLLIVVMIVKLQRATFLYNIGHKALQATFSYPFKCNQNLKNKYPDDFVSSVL